MSKEVCNRCGNTGENKYLGVRVFRSVAFPKSKPFYRLVCDGCGWFGKPRSK